jgi:myo-inositol 2-dehydrogenase / D-chiro-inositol 1-dehydrogenase
MMKEQSKTRRSFLKKSALATASLSTFMIAKPGTALGVDANSKIHMAIIGCGGRGQHDGRNLFKTGNVKIAALADYFDFQAKSMAKTFEVDEKDCYWGIDAYKDVCARKDIDAVLLTTAPYFRPVQFEEAIKQGKHVFTEKPVATDPWGCRLFLKVGKQAEEKKLVVVAGLQTRYEKTRQKIAALIQDGAIGELMFGHCTRMGGDLWRRERKPDFTERDFQVRNWLYYNWASGDFLTEQHIHNIDVFNWFSGTLPVSAVGSGGRKVRTDIGDIYDYIQVVWEYPNGFSLAHTGSQVNKGYSNMVSQIQGTNGYYDQQGWDGKLVIRDGETIEHGGIGQASEQEMIEFTEAVLGKRDYINNSEYVTTSTFTCLLARKAAYEGRRVQWKELWDSNEKFELPS